MPWEARSCPQLSLAEQHDALQYVLVRSQVDRHENLLSKTEKWKQGTPEGRQSMKERQGWLTNTQ